MGESILVRIVPPGGQRPTHEQRVRGELAVREMRLAIEANFEPAVVIAQRIHHALHDLAPGFELRERTPDPFARAFFERLIDDLETDFELGRLIVTQGAQPLLGITPEFELAPRTPLPPIELPPPAIARARAPDRLTFFEVRFVDEVGQAIGGLDVELRAGRSVEQIATNPAGVALLEDVESMSASVGVVSIDALEQILEPRWSRVRPGAPPGGPNTKVFAFTGAAIDSISLKPAVPNTVVITPPRGKLFVELLDKKGRVRHAGLPYEISGPQSFSGTTDDQGRLLHEGVPPGDYLLKLSVEGEPCETPVVALDPSEVKPQTRFLGAVPRVVLARIKKFVFETNKSFLLPDAVTALAGVADLYREESPASSSW